MPTISPDHYMRSYSDAQLRRILAAPDYFSRDERADAAAILRHRCAGWQTDPTGDSMFDPAMHRNITSVTLDEHVKSGLLVAVADGPAGIWTAASRSAALSLGAACASAAYGDPRGGNGAAVAYGASALITTTVVAVALNDERDLREHRAQMAGRINN